MVADSHCLSPNGLHLNICHAYSLVSTFLSIALALAISLARQSCADVTVYFARGTGEPGTFGLIVGSPFKSALQSALSGKSLDFIGTASIPGVLARGHPGCRRGEEHSG